MKRRLWKIKITFGPGIPSDCFNFSLSSCRPVIFANIIGSDPLRLLRSLLIGGEALWDGDIWAEEYKSES